MSNTRSLLNSVAQWLAEARSAVAFTGAGISTESGIPDFRSPGGVWATSQPVYFDEFLSSAEARHEYWRQKSVAHHGFMSSQPNAGHQVLARWEADGQLLAVITQNIDGLHQLAGAKRVYELHGTARHVSCLDCEARFDADPWVKQFEASQQVPSCPECAGLLKHATISFGQMLDSGVVQSCVELAQHCDLFLCIGSSLVVEPAASLPRLARECGARLVILNRDPTPQDRAADAVLRGEIGSTLTELDRLRREQR